MHRVRKTGGGPAPEKLSPATLLIKEMLPNEFLQLRNKSDDDAELNEDAISA